MRLREEVKLLDPRPPLAAGVGFCAPLASIACACGVLATGACRVERRMWGPQSRPARPAALSSTLSPLSSLSPLGRARPPACCPMPLGHTQPACRQLLTPAVVSARARGVLDRPSGLLCSGRTAANALHPHLPPLGRSHSPSSPPTPHFSFLVLHPSLYLLILAPHLPEHHSPLPLTPHGQTCQLRWAHVPPRRLLPPFPAAAFN